MLTEGATEPTLFAGLPFTAEELVGIFDWLIDSEDDPFTELDAAVASPAAPLTAWLGRRIEILPWEGLASFAATSGTFDCPLGAKF